MKARVALVLLIVLTFVSSAEGQYAVESLGLTVYADGYVRIDQIIRPDNYTVGVSIPLLASNVEGLVVIDGNENPLPYEMNGTKLIVYFENATSIKITYYTPDLTSKNGAIWSVRFSSEVPVKITFPENAVIVDLTDIPIKINGNSLVMPAGNQSVSYVIQYRPGETAAPPTTTPESGTLSQTTTQNGTGTAPEVPGTETPTEGSQGGALIGAAAVIVLAVAGFVYFRTKGKETQSPGISREDFERRLREYELTKDEEKALLYLFDRGGKAKQSEVREMLGIPKTTAWRMFQRLEKQGLVRVYKKKRENWVELKL
ncbi:winged helix-turn-helix transcriptional regulator [Thermococcus sp. M36]|uniref:helix-turn-helix transcriptional regulator n=1 Tax=Thermococcus sp. M36 TaxID=1638261 RepID=UPI00143A9082|nr:helix-turn-helix domain-containing protein [Thermococcus sp. M36]NJE06138.1 winged helix-turn-helix transcriptional regulator [Thermococcus sp. M36]